MENSNLLIETGFLTGILSPRNISDCGFWNNSPQEEIDAAINAAPKTQKVIGCDYDDPNFFGLPKMLLTIDVSREDKKSGSTYSHVYGYYAILKKEPIPQKPTGFAIEKWGFKLIEDRENGILWVDNTPLCQFQEIRWTPSCYDECAGNNSTVITYIGHGNVTLTENLGEGCGQRVYKARI
jgi:hypothetical protein